MPLVNPPFHQFNDNIKSNHFLITLTVVAVPCAPKEANVELVGWMWHRLCSSSPDWIDLTLCPLCRLLRRTAKIGLLGLGLLWHNRGRCWLLGYHLQSSLHNCGSAIIQHIASINIDIIAQLRYPPWLLLPLLFSAVRLFYLFRIGCIDWL